MKTIHCDTNYIGQHIIQLEETDSTNDVIKRLLKDGVTLESNCNGVGRLIEGSPAEGLLVTADNQTAGRGRRGRVWSTEPEESLSMSILLKPQMPTDRMAMITLVAAMAVARSLKDLYNVMPKIKWPNDIVLGNRKVCGILTELQMVELKLNDVHNTMNVHASREGKTFIDYMNAAMDTHKQPYVIVGIGVNVNQGSWPDEIADTATSIYLQTGKKAAKEVLVESIAKNLEAYYERFLEYGDMSGLYDEYNEWLAGRGAEVKVLDPNGEYVGVSEGIDPNGNLLVRDKSGKINKVYSGEVSVRGIYGYV